MTFGLYSWPSASAKRSSMMRWRSSSAAALLGAQIRMRGFAARLGKSRSSDECICPFNTCEIQPPSIICCSRNQGFKLNRVSAIVKVSRCQDQIYALMVPRSIYHHKRKWQNCLIPKHSIFDAPPARLKCCQAPVHLSRFCTATFPLSPAPPQNPT